MEKGVRTLIQISHLTKVFGSGFDEVTALHDVNISAEKGDVYGIIGMSGAGKSTLLRCIALLDRPTSGEITVDGTDLLALSPKELRDHRKTMGVIFQGYNLLEQRTVRQNIAFPLSISHWETEKIDARVNELLELVSLTDKAEVYPSQLSGGQKQRVAIARALAAESKVLLCDEPTSALDPLTTRSILKLLRKINQELGETILIITHEIGVVKAICNKVAVIDQGRVVESGLVSDVMYQPQSPITQSLLSLEGGVL